MSVNRWQELTKKPAMNEKTYQLEISEPRENVRSSDLPEEEHKLRTECENSCPPHSTQEARGQVRSHDTKTDRKQKII